MADKPNGSIGYELMSARQDTAEERLDDHSDTLDWVRSTVEKHSVYFESLKEDMTEIKELQKRTMDILAEQNAENTKLGAQFKIVLGIAGAIGCAMLSVAAKFIFGS
jgi:chromosome segregation ATPase